MYENKNYEEDFVTITATISDIISEKKRDSYTHEVYVTYEYDGEVYENMRFNMYSSDMYVGKEIEILCDSEHPDRITAKGTHQALGFFYIVMGGAFMFFTTIITIVTVSGYRKLMGTGRNLMKKGLKLNAVVESVQQESSTSYGYVIYCTFTDISTNTMYRFKSKPLASDPSMYVYQGMPIEVYVDRKDFSRYYVNTEMLRVQSFVELS